MSANNRVYFVSYYHMLKQGTGTMILRTSLDPEEPDFLPSIEAIVAKDSDTHPEYISITNISSLK